MAIGRISPYNPTEMSRNLVLDIRLLLAAAPTWRQRLYFVAERLDDIRLLLAAAPTWAAASRGFAVYQPN